MNHTRFTIYTNQLDEPAQGGGGGAAHADMGAQGLTRALYTRNCERKMAGNLSSMFQVSHAKNKIAGRMIPSLVLDFWDKKHRDMRRHIAGIFWPL